jgi:uncharacterized delta-60 repeat protein
MKSANRSFLVCIVLFPLLAFSPKAYSQWWTFGGNLYDVARSAQQTPDGGYVVAGWTNNYGAGGKDFLVLKLTASGGIEWQKAFGGSDYDVAYSIQPASDPKYGDGYIVAGETASFGAGNYDFLLLKLTTSGAVQWRYTLGGSTWDHAYSVIQASDDCYVAAGTTASFGAGASDVLVAKVTTGGGIQWAKTYGGAGYEYAKCIRQTSDGGYIIAGWTDSSGTGGRDFLVLKVGSTGAFQWARTYGGVHNDEAYSIDEAPDNGYFVAGYAYTSETDSKDFLILKLSSTGSIQWQKTFGSSDEEIAYSAPKTADGGCVVVGSSSGSDPELDPNFFFVIKLSNAGGIQFQKMFNPDEGTQGANSIDQTADGGYVLAGMGYQKFLVAKLDSAGTIPGCPNIWDTYPGQPYAYIAAGVPSIAEASVSLAQGNPGVVVTDVAVTRAAHCTIGGACAGE